MNKLLAVTATILTCFAVYLGSDPGGHAFTNVDVGGHELRMLLSGHGSPTVVFESGGACSTGGPLEAWTLVQPQVSKFARTVSYDRAGIGWSAPGPKPRDARQVARELHTALLTAHVAPPYILVGHSFGGPLNRVFADMYPGEVAGMVLADPTQEEFMDWMQAQSPGHEAGHDRELNELQTSLTQAHESQVPPGIPIILITGMGPRVLPASMTDDEKEKWKIIKAKWLKFHQEWVDKLPNAQHIVSDKSGHGVPFEEPELIIQEIRKVVERARLTPDRH